MMTHSHAMSLVASMTETRQQGIGKTGSKDPRQCSVAYLKHSIDNRGDDGRLEISSESD
jgi:hypothetical protein